MAALCPLCFECIAACTAPRCLLQPRSLLADLSLLLLPEQVHGGISLTLRGGINKGLVPYAESLIGKRIIPSRPASLFLYFPDPY